MIKCTECGYENMDGLDYCDGCGARLAASEGAAAAPGATPAPEAAPSVAAEAAPAPSAAAGTTIDANSAEHPASAAAALTAANEAAGSTEGEPPPASEAKTGEITPPPAPSAAPAAAMSADFKAKLSLLRGGRKGQEFPLDSGQNFIGRWDPETGSFPEVDLEQDDPEAKISRKHALIIIEGGKITIEDIGSLNGTYVNRGNRLIPGTPLEIKAGDEVIIGKTFLKLVVDPIS
jgi:FHA domain-containing protein